MSSKLLYACSTNPGKLREFELAARRAAGFEYRIVPLPELRTIPAPEENGNTFEENALLKAKYYSRFSDELVFADDSGLEVAALDGAPGVFSARFAGPNATDEANNDLLLSRLADAENRTARFVCVIALARAGAPAGIFTAEVQGEILHERRGDGGFGYDPLFFFPPLGKTFAEISGEQKLEISHRGLALQQLITYLSRGKLRR